MSNDKEAARHRARPQPELLDQLARAVKVKLAWPDNNNWKGFREQFEDEYRRLWLLQNRPGGLEESLDWQFCR